jgi:ABC-type multidrug transport system fused ATPase/permease subunit
MSNNNNNSNHHTKNMTASSAAAAAATSAAAAADDDDDTAHQTHNNHDSSLHHPMTDAPVWSRLLFHWPVSLLRLGMQRPLQTGDLWQCLPVDSSACNLALFQQLWQQEQEYCSSRIRQQQQQQQQIQQQSNNSNNSSSSNNNISSSSNSKDNIKPSLRRALVRDFFVSTWFVQPLMMIASAAKIVQAVALGNLIEYFEHASSSSTSSSNAASAAQDEGEGDSLIVEEPYSSTDGYFWATVLVFCGLFVLFEHHHVFFWTWRKGMQIRIACVAAIYEKSLTLSSVDSETSASYGKIMNLASNDVERFLVASLFCSYLFWAPLQALAILVVGSIAIQDAIAFGSGFALLIVFFAPLQFYLSKSFAKHRSTIAAITDRRVQFCSQAVRGARVMKMSGYEERFLQRIQDYRKQEMQQIQKAQKLKAYNESIFFASNVVISVVIFFVHVVLNGGYLTPGNVFTVFTLVNILQLEVTKHVSIGVMGCSECNVSIQRIQNFLEFPEIQLNKEIDKNTTMLTTCQPRIVSGDEEAPTTTTTQTTTASNGNSPASDHDDIIISMKNVTCYWDHVKSSSSSFMSLQDCEVTVGDSLHTTNDAGADAGANSSSTLPTPTSRTVTHQQETEEEKQQQQQDEAAPSTFSLALKDISLDFRRGQLTSIIGTVGSGKSALLQAIIRELPVYSGSITMKNSGNSDEEKEDAFPTIAYAAQDPWIMDGTVKENIIMGGARQPRRKRNSQDNEEECAYEDTMDALSDDEWYQQVIEACSLLPDLKQFRHGDATIVGDRGVQCSGGQRARIGLARALYRNADILVADDPLSAVDAKVGRQLFQIAIMKLSVQRNKCVILATHQHQYINLRQDEQGDEKEHEAAKYSQCVLMTAGKMEFIGTYHECIAASNGKLTAHTADDAVDSSMRETAASTETNVVVAANKIVDVDDPIDEGDAVTEAKNIASLAADEQKEMSNQGIVRFDTYINYLKAMGGIYVGLFLAVLFSATQASVLLTIASVGRWAEQPAERQSDWENVGLVLGMAGVVVILAVGRAFLTMCLFLKASQRLHDRMAEAVLRAKISFFDTNPLGRILNRFSADVGITDDLLPTTWFDFLVVAFIVLGSVVTTVTTLPYALVVIPPLGLYFWRVRYVFVTSTRELKRLEGLARSPIFAMLGESLGGIATIRANNFLDYFRFKFRQAHDAHTQAFFAFISASRWVGIRMDSLVYSFLVIVSYLSLFVQQKQWFDIDPSILGLSISFLLYLAGLFQWCIRQSAEVVNQSTFHFVLCWELDWFPFTHPIPCLLSSGLGRTHSCLWFARARSCTIQTKRPRFDWSSRMAKQRCH